MRPLRVDLRGFTVFREPTVIDLTDTDFFALVGPTGSGKSTVLDAICFALYGQVPRWGTKSVANALAPSTAEASVRLIFEAAGIRYAVTRVVRRDGKGRTTTRAAGLQELPAGFDLSLLDSGELPAEALGDVLAGTPTELDTVIVQVVGLPYDQFTKCVLLPQGDFAAFLHARPAERQEILVKLLGLSVYDEIRDRATIVERAAAAKLAASDQLLKDLEAGSGDDVLTAAEDRVAAAQTLAQQMATVLPELREADRRLAEATDGLAAMEAQLGALTGIRPPVDADGIARAAAQAQTVATAAAEAVTAAEEHDQKLRARHTTLGDPAHLSHLLKAYAERSSLRGRRAEMATALGDAKAAHDQAAHVVETAAAQAAEAQAAVIVLREALERAQTADRAASLRPALVAGHSCPVCEQTVAIVPAAPDVPAMRAAREALALGEQRAERAQRARDAQSGTLRSADRALATAEERTHQLDDQLSRLDAVLADAPPAEELRSGLAAIAEAQEEIGTAGAAVSAARERQRAAASRLAAADDKLRRSWLDFDATRDRLSGLGVSGLPAVDRAHLSLAWEALAGWAGSAASTLQTQCDSHRADAAAAQAAKRAAHARITEWFTQAEATLPSVIGQVEIDRAVTITVERATAARDKVVDARAQAEKLRVQRGTVEDERRVAAALAGHLKANNFEAWLLEEALDALVSGASVILRELTSGQYELIHDAREFFVVDHHDAGLRRPVRTLSGGETFQASLALALALADQLATMSHTASLESIMLDEGFGTLDSSTLDTVAATLENLAAQGDRMVGVVTHVAALAERIPVRFEITKDARTARVERVG
ncbi:exonuclease SbcC [Allocatelliglobosispora scoriae]|uniref:Nuclease SbcCD subunit C n=1 Tax=Allocatelliglobosispora scoriae TaxID=643052 RepID=A0A841C0A9_9ACTN|nr:SMC family ATPase [Allocatelliglobosispora scoriae]MBB5872482.1 exonuclease SbcC [Allocatelliglobosispora scoriae]